MSLPSREKCLELMRKQNPEHIVEHSMQTEKIATYLAGKLKEHGIELDVDLVSRGALLHDIAKFNTLDSDVLHGEKGYEMLMGEGFAKIALIAKEHALSEILNPGALKSWESRLVYYADKRVNNSSIVSLAERFEYMRERYGSIGKGIMDTINKCEKPCIELEDELFKKAGVDKELRELK